MEEQERREPVWKTLVVGFLVGIGAIVPGVSGGAFAVIFGLYDKIMTYIGTFYREFFKKMKFLVPFAVGVGVAVLSLSQLLDPAFARYPMQMAALFIGLIIGTGPSMVKTARKEGFRRWYLLLMVAVGGATWLLLNIQGIAWTGGNQMPWYMLAITGVVLGFGTIVPGLSASALLTSLGLYQPTLALFSLSTLKQEGIWSRAVDAMWFVGGFGLCVLLFSRLVSWLYKKAYGATSFGVLGMLVASVIMMGMTFVTPHAGVDIQTLLAVGLAAVGGALTWLLLRKGAH